MLLYFEHKLLGTSSGTKFEKHKLRKTGSKEPALQCSRCGLAREDPLEEEMATYSSILARKISWTEEPGGLLSMGSQGVGRD